ncbi:hypothetical protein EDD37DRAFT_672026, partial [Exophiala viscosa]|uniref:uncharacterized protein n=1 Tax=Exophiala viscosa TaxID=2486360 RepID=UPI0021969FA9
TRVTGFVSRQPVTRELVLLNLTWGDCVAGRRPSSAWIYAASHLPPQVASHSTSNNHVMASHQAKVLVRHCVSPSGWHCENKLNHGCQSFLYAFVRTAESQLCLGMAHLGRSWPSILLPPVQQANMTKSTKDCLFAQSDMFPGYMPGIPSQVRNAKDSKSGVRRRYKNKRTDGTVSLLLTTPALACDFTEDLSLLKGRRGSLDYIPIRRSYIVYDIHLSQLTAFDRLYIPW